MTAPKNAGIEAAPPVPLLHRPRRPRGLGTGKTAGLPGQLRKHLAGNRANDATQPERNFSSALLPRPRSVAKSVRFSSDA